MTSSAPTPLRRPVAEVLVRAAALGAAVGALVGLLALPVAVLVSGLADHSPEAVGTALTQFASVGYEVVFTGIGLAVGVATGLASAGVWLALVVVLKVRPWLAWVAAALAAAVVVAAAALLVLR